MLTSLLKSMSRGVTWSNIGFDAWEPVITSSQYMESIWNWLCVWRNRRHYWYYTFSVHCLFLALKQKSKDGSFPDLLTVIGGSTPSIVIALALVITFSGNFGLNLYSSMWILVVSYLVKYMTMSVRTIAASLSQVHVSLEEAALNSGASWIRTCKRYYYAVDRSVHHRRLVPDLYAVFLSADHVAPSVRCRN